METSNQKWDAAGIWSALGSDLWRYLHRRVRDDATADDLLQETFLRIHRRIATLEDADRVAAWVYRIAQNVLTDHYRARSQDEVAAVAELHVDGAADLARSQWSAMTGKWLAEMVEQLPETYRQAVRLSELYGLSQREVADRLGLSLSGAKSRIQRGRALLKQILLGCCDFVFDRRGNIVDCTPRPDRRVCRDCEDPRIKFD